MMKLAFGEVGMVQYCGESTRLPPLWLGTQRHMWLELVVGSRPYFKGFSLGFPISSLHKKSQFDPEMRATGLSALLLSVTLTK